MLYSFLKYFSLFLFKGKQWALMLSVLGLVISAFSLLVLQSIMGGLQDKLMARAKAIQGEAVIYLDMAKGHKENKNEVEELSSFLERKSLKFSREYVMELILKKNKKLLPVILHALDFNSNFIPNLFLSEDHEGLLLPYNIAIKMDAIRGDLLTLVSMAHSDFVITEVPRMKTFFASGVLSTQVPELDTTSIWADMSVAHALIRENSVNTIRIFSKTDFKVLKNEILNLVPSSLFKTWEEENNTLVFALKLENFILIFLFIGMTLLVSLCITSGLMLFFREVLIALSSFWILGASKRKLMNANWIFLQGLSFFASSSGIILALVFLFLLDSYGGDIMPEVFVERKIPIKVTPTGLFLSFFIPYLMALVFSYMALNDFNKKQDFLKTVRVY